MMRLAVTLAACLVSGSAWASGGASCSNDGGDAAINLEAGITRGMGGPIFALTGSADVSAADVAEDLRKTAFEREHAAQYWLDGKELRLLLYRERPAEKEHGYVELEIRTQADPEDESTYAGTYALKFWDTAGGGDPKDKVIEGKITCMVE